MKRKWFILLAAVLALTCFAPAALAADDSTQPLTISISRDVKTQVITASGVYQNGYGQMMTVVAELLQESEDGEGTVNAALPPAYLNQFFITDESGAYSHSFRIPESSAVGTYRITVTAADTGASAYGDVAFVSEEEQLEAVALLREAANTSGTEEQVAQAVGAVLVEHATELMLDMTDYNQLGSRAQKVNALVAAGVKAQQPQDVVAVYEIFHPAMAVASVEGCGAENVAAVLEQYSDVISVDLAQLEDLNEEARQYALNWLQSGSYDATEEIETAYTDALILGTVSKPENYSEIQQALLVTYADKLQLDTTKYNQISNKNNVFLAMLNGNYQSVDQLRTAFYQAVDNQLNAEKTPGGGGGGGGSIGGGGGGGTTVSGGVSGQPALPGSSENEETQNKVFQDMDSTPWAQDAVQQLYEKGVVQASADGRFRPEDSITRAEFLAMIVRAFGLEQTGQTTTFQDVAQSDWYYGIVAAAQASGIVQGAGDGTFSPNANISRQDMAVMMDRAAKVCGVTFGMGGSAAPFTDADQIAGYAADAVDTMRRAGILNGNGDGTFAPQQQATRAESAKMIAAVMAVAGR